MLRLLAVAATLVSLLATPLAAQTLTDPAATSEGQSSSEGAGETAAKSAAQSAGELAEILQDPEARQALIERLLEVAEGAGADAAAEGSPAETAQEDTSGEETSLARRLAEYTSTAAEGVSESAGELLRSFVLLTDMLGRGDAVDWSGLQDAAIALGSVILVVLVALWLLRRIGSRIFAAMAQRADRFSMVRRVLLIVASSLIDAVMVVMAWGIGYAFALATGDPGTMGVRQGLFLNAFLMIELIKVVMRFALAPGFGDLRLWPLSDTSANYWYFWTSRLIGLLGYGLMLVVPIVNTHLSYRAGNAVELVIVLTALVMSVTIILQNRDSVQQGFNRRAEEIKGEFVSQLMLLLGRCWHLLAVAYVFVAFVIWVTRPGDAMAFMAQATLQSILAIAIGSLVTLFIGRAITGGMRLPESLRQQLPLLQKRLNTYVPMILRVVRLVVLFCVLLAILQAWQLIDVAAWLDSPVGREAIARIVTAALIVLGAIAIWVALSSWIEYRITPSSRRAPTPRERTLLALFRNATAIALTVLTIMLALSELGVNIGPLLAGAGVVGLAIGFGAQKLVQDIINGAFIQFENAMNEGDVVTAGGITGVVERLTIRSLGLRDLHGTYHLIPFSSVDQVSNFMRGFAYHVAEIGVAYRENVAEVKDLLQTAFERLKEKEIGNDIIGDLEMHGVTSLGDSAVVVRCRIKTRPGSQWAMGRAFNEIVKEVLDDAGVEIPFPHMTLYMGEEKDGGAPPLRVINQDAGEPGRDEEGGQADARKEPEEETRVDEATEETGRPKSEA